MVACGTCAAGRPEWRDWRAMLASPRCGAKTRAGTPCRSPAMENGCCRMHGGTSTGPRTEAGRGRCRDARLIHGCRSAVAIEENRRLRLAVRRARAFDRWIAAGLPDAGPWSFLPHGLRRGEPEAAMAFSPRTLALFRPAIRAPGGDPRRRCRDAYFWRKARGLPAGMNLLQSSRMRAIELVDPKVSGERVLCMGSFDANRPNGGNPPLEKPAAAGNDGARRRVLPVRMARDGCLTPPERGS